MKVIISTHEFATGPAQELRNYLNASSNNEVAFIASKFVRKKNRVTYVDIYEKGNLLLNLTSPDFHFLPELLIYLKDLFFTIYYAFILPGKWDVFVAGDGSLTIPGYLLKKMGKVNKVAFYTIDFSPKRFKNKFLNWLYFKFDEFGVKTADEVWNVSPRMVEGRKKVYNLDSKYDQKQKVVPLGAWFDRIPRVPFEKSLQNTVVYMGHVLEKQGIQHVVKSMPSLKKKGIDIRLRVIGEGEYLKTLKDLAKSLDVSGDIDFLGYIEDHKKVEERIAECALAVALYENDTRSFTYYADPGKIKNYLASGVPVLITDVPAVAAELQEKNAGVIVEANQKSIEVSLEKLLSSPEKLSQMRENAVALGKRYDWNRIFDNLGLD